MLARLYLQRGETAPARKEFETLRKIAPTDPRVPLALGLTSLQAKRYGEAEQYLKEYLRPVETVPGASPDVAYQYLAEIAEQRKDYRARSAGSTASTTAGWRRRSLSSVRSCWPAWASSTRRMRSTPI